jgi:uncharacterized protein
MQQMSTTPMAFLRGGLLALSLGAVAHPAVGADAALRTVSVTGMGEVRANPDVAFVTLGVESRQPVLADARAAVSAAADRVLALTRELKIDPRYVDSTRLQVQPEYRWNDKDSQRVLLGYMVSRQIEVELRDLDQLGPLLERAVTAGANQVGEARLDSIKRKELERDALVRAVADARLNAEALVKAAGAQLGPVRSLSASADPPVMPLYRERAMMSQAADQGPEQSYGSAEMKFTARVSAQYDLVTP